MATFANRMKSAWNAFSNDQRDALTGGPQNAPVYNPLGNFGSYISTQPQRNRLRIGSERSIISSIYTRMSIDISSVEIRHTRHDDQDRYLEDIRSGFNECLTVEANIDQAARAFRQDVVLTLFDKGVACIVPVDTTLSPLMSGGYDIKTMRVGDITQWYPNHVRVNLYNELIGQRQEIVLPKRNVAIVENPLYSVMNEPNSTLQRLMRKLAMLDSVDEATSSGKLDMIIQLPYVIKSDARRTQAEQRRQDIEFQLKGSQYGIAYTDGTEKITQLNRPAENNLLGQIEYLTNLLYAQLGITPEVMNGTANEAAMLNYNNRTIEPIMGAIVEALKRVFVTKTARSQGQSVDYFINPFKLIPMSDLAEISDKMTRNEIMTSNEIRQFIGMKPSNDPKADQLINSNMPQGDTGVPIPAGDGTNPSDDDTDVSDGSDDTEDDSAPQDVSSFDGIQTALADAFRTFGADPPDLSSLTPPGGDIDPDVMLAALAQLDTLIDSAFSVGGDDDDTS